MHPVINFKRLLDRSSVFRAVVLLEETGLAADTVCQCSEDIVEYLYALRECTRDIPIIFWLWEMNFVYGLPAVRGLGNACLGLNVMPNMEERQFETYVPGIRDLGLPVCAAMAQKKQLEKVRKWHAQGRLDLLVTSGITPRDLQ